MLHQTEAINSNGHAHVKEAFQKYYFYDASVWYESTKSVYFFSLNETKQNAALNEANILNKSMYCSLTAMKLAIL